MDPDPDERQPLDGLLQCLRSHAPFLPGATTALADSQVQAFFQRADVRDEAQSFICALQRMWEDANLGRVHATEAPNPQSERSRAGHTKGWEKSESTLEESALANETNEQPGSTHASAEPQCEPASDPLQETEPSPKRESEPVQTPPHPSSVPDMPAAAQGGVQLDLRPGVSPGAQASRMLPQHEKVSFTLEKNAKAGEEFRSGIRIARGVNVEILEVTVPEGIGVSYNAELRELSGIPTVAGDHPIKILYRLAHHSQPNRPKELPGECTLTVNPDPRSLWKDLQSDQSDPDWKPDTDKRYLQGDHGWRLAAASKRGRSHAHAGGFREDDFFLDATSGWNVLAVADGAGSAKMSRRASQIAVQNAGEFLKVALRDQRAKKLEEAVAQSVSTSSLHPAAAAAYPILGGAVFKAAKAIEDEAEKRGIPVKDYSTTLILGVHKRTSHGHLLASYWVGDGAVAAYRKGLGVEVLGEPDSGEFAGQTRFLDPSMVCSYDDILKRIRVTLLDDLTALMLMTDGVSDPMFETDRNLEDLSRWDAFWGREIEPLLADDAPDDRLLGWLDFWSQGNHDDRTIAVLW